MKYGILMTTVQGQQILHQEWITQGSVKQSRFWVLELKNNFLPWVWSLGYFLSLDYPLAT